MKSVVIFNILRTYKDFILFKTQQATTKARRQILKREKSIQAFSHLITETLVVYCRGHQQIDFITLFFIKLSQATTKVRRQILKREKSIQAFSSIY